MRVKRLIFLQTRIFFIFALDRAEEPGHDRERDGAQGFNCQLNCQKVVSFWLTIRFGDIVAWGKMYVLDLTPVLVTYCCLSPALSPSSSSHPRKSSSKNSTELLRCCYKCGSVYKRVDPKGEILGWNFITLLSCTSLKWLFNSFFGPKIFLLWKILRTQWKLVVLFLKQTAMIEKIWAQRKFV